MVQIRPPLPTFEREKASGDSQPGKRAQFERDLPEATTALRTAESEWRSVSGAREGSAPPPRRVMTFGAPTVSTEEQNAARLDEQRQRREFGISTLRELLGDTTSGGGRPPRGRHFR